jgi:hypothetical protein
MIDQVVAASVSAASAASAPGGCVSCVPIDDKTILDWCFVIGSLNFSVLGFVYGIYANARLNNLGDLAILSFLRMYCSVIVSVIWTLTALAGFIAFSISARPAVWIVVGCLAIVSVFSLVLVKKMWTPPLHPPIE